MADINLVQGSTGKVLTYRMVIPDPNNGQVWIPLNLTLAEAIRFRMFPVGCAPATALLGGLATKLGPPLEGGVSYAIQAADVRRPGEFWAVFDARFPGGDIVTLPENRYLSVRVMARLVPAIP